MTVSVAFRRDSDEEHREPRFEIPIPAGPNFVTANGLKNIEARISELEQCVSGETDGLRLAEAQRDLRYWRTRLATAQLAPPPAPGQVGIGSHVRFRLRGERRDMQVVGHDEAEPASNRIAFSSPLGRVLMGSEAGDVLGFGGDPDVLEIVEIQEAEPFQPV
jgi:transcription elongation GreA/GreB family factor